LVVNQSGRCLAGYVYASCGVHESTTDVVFGGHCMIAENGTLLAESNRFEREPFLLVHDIDLGRLEYERWKMNSFGDSQPNEFHGDWSRIVFKVPYEGNGLIRDVDPHPFVPRGQDRLRHRCEEIFQTQVAGLAKRLEHLGSAKLTLGVSGGLDSTLSLLVTCKTLDLIKWPRTSLHAFTLPGFGTTARTLTNARQLMALLGVTAREVDIRAMCLEEMRAVGHRPFGLDLSGLTVEQLSEKLRHLPAIAAI
jgi:NAD+ synthase (glutamine-hydrolysing)